MESRARILTLLVLALWATIITGQDFCAGKPDGPYCQHCWQPIDCKDEVISATYHPCTQGQACMVAFGASFCVSHDQTECACDGTADQCDPYNNLYIEHCLASGPFLVEPCAGNATCYNGECGGEQPECTPDSWNLLTPECTEAVYCDADGIGIAVISCEDGQYVNSELDCSPAPPPACDGSCTGRCPNPVDCSKFIVCNGGIVITSGDCPEATFFDIESQSCIDTNYTCTPTDQCDFEIDLGTTSTLVSEAPTTTTEGSGVTTSTGGSGAPTTTGGSGVTTTTGGSAAPTTTGGSAAPTTTGGSGAPTTTGGSGVTTSTGGSGAPTTTGGSGITTTSTGSTGITTSSIGSTGTTISLIPDTTTETIYTTPSEDSCNESTVGSRYPSGPCSQNYYICMELISGEFEFLPGTCLGDQVFNPDPTLPYCMSEEDVESCQ